LHNPDCCCQQAFDFFVFLLVYCLGFCCCCLLSYHQADNEIYAQNYGDDFSDYVEFASENYGDGSLADSNNKNLGDNIFTCVWIVSTVSNNFAMGVVLVPVFQGSALRLPRLLERLLKALTKSKYLKQLKSENKLLTYLIKLINPLK
jgi:hypothetical protein